MDFTKFMEEAKKYLEVYTEGKREIRFQDVVKNNGIILKGLMIQCEDEKVYQTIYPMAFYKQYQQGREFDDIMQEIAALYDNHQIGKGFDMSFYSDLEVVKSRIAFKLVNKRRNEELLKEIPYVPYLNMAIVFYYSLSKGDMGCASILIKNNHLDMWNLSISELYKLAYNNTRLLNIPECVDMVNMIKEFHGIDENNETELARIAPMYVLTNEQRLYGAANILYPEYLEDIAQRVDSDIYIIPSSVHEVITIPAYMVESVDYLQAMVMEVNRNEVREEDYLSDGVYLYSRETKEVEQVK